MAEGTRQGITYVFQRQGKDAIPRRELEFILSIELGWYDPDGARRFVEGALAQGLLRDSDSGLVPTFDVRAEEIPLHFQPPVSGSDGGKGGMGEDPFLPFLDDLAIRLGLDRTDLLRRIHERMEGSDLPAPVLALLIAREEGIDVTSLVDAAEALVRLELSIDKPA